jgi:hypothetical protein
LGGRWTSDAFWSYAGDLQAEVDRQLAVSVGEQAPGAEETFVWVTPTVPAPAATAGASALRRPAPSAAGGGWRSRSANPRVGERAISTLEIIDDDESEQGLSDLRVAAAQSPSPRTITTPLGVLVFRPATGDSTHSA